MTRRIIEPWALWLGVAYLSPFVVPLIMAMPQAAPAVALRVEPSCTVSPASPLPSVSQEGEEK